MHHCIIAPNLKLEGVFTPDYRSRGHVNIEPSNTKIKLHTQNCKLIIPDSKIILSANKDSVFSVDGEDEGI